MDEVIYPVDFKSAGHIVDDESAYTLSTKDRPILMRILKCESYSAGVAVCPS